VDERLSALRTTPDLRGQLKQRLSRGRLLAQLGRSRNADGVVFYKVLVTRRTSGWVQREAVVIPTHAGDDQRLFQLIQSSDEFDRIARARIFLDFFQGSPLRPAVLLIYADAAEAAAEKLSRDAGRRLREAGPAPEFSYFLNFNGLDRYNRQKVRFEFDTESKKFHYDGAAWREIVKRYPRSAEAAIARERLAGLHVSQQ
jgi:hypothetical protein